MMEDTGMLRLTYERGPDGTLVGHIDCCEGSWAVRAVKATGQSNGFDIAVKPYEDDPDFVNEVIDLPADVEFSLLTLLADLLEEKPSGQSQ